MLANENITVRTRLGFIGLGHLDSPIMMVHGRYGLFLNCLGDRKRGWLRVPSPGYRSSRCNCREKLRRHIAGSPSVYLDRRLRTGAHRYSS